MLHCSLLSQALCHILHQLRLSLIRFHQEAFKQAPYAAAAPAFHSHAWCRVSDVTCLESKEVAKRRERRRKEGWDHLNKTEGQSNNKTSIPPLPVLMLISYFCRLGALCEWGVGSWLVLNRPATSGLMEKAALWKIEKKGIRASRHTHSAASSSTVFLSSDVVCAGTGMTKANYCCHFIKGIRLARAGKAPSGMCKSHWK